MNFEPEDQTPQMETKKNTEEQPVTLIKLDEERHAIYMQYKTAENEYRTITEAERHSDYGECLLSKIAQYQNQIKDINVQMKNCLL